MPLQVQAVTDMEMVGMGAELLFPPSAGLPPAGCVAPLLWKNKGLNPQPPEPSPRSTLVLRGCGPVTSPFFFWVWMERGVLCFSSQAGVRRTLKDEVLKRESGSLGTCG